MFGEDNCRICADVQKLMDASTRFALSRVREGATS
jgi:hypothetical protein